MQVNVYLPEDLGRQAKEQKLPFSRLIQAAIKEELARRRAVEAAMEAAAAALAVVERAHMLDAAELRTSD